MTRAAKELGVWGEDRAAQYFARQGWTVLERNWRCREGEADLICLDPEKSAVVVVEVKTRAGTKFGNPLETITYAKVRKLRQLAAIYARQQRLQIEQLRVDAVGILWPTGGEPKLTHVRGIEEL